MLRWRLSLGALIIAGLVGLFGLDYWLEQLTAVPGIALFPLLLGFAVLGSREMLQLTQAAGRHPVPWTVYFGSLLVAASGWIVPLVRRLACTQPQDCPTPAGNATLLALGAALILVFAAEMYRYDKPGGVTVNAAAALFAIVYVGLLLSFMVQLRLAWGLGALASLLIVAKMGDTGAYAVGRLFGRNKMAPRLSPGKTIEGAVGAIGVACAASWATFHWLVPLTRPEDASPGPWWGWILFGLLVGIAGMAGDLAESLIKRDCQQKDSGNWIPGFGGVLDILDSPLLAAPVAYACWAFGLVG